MLDEIVEVGHEAYDDGTRCRAVVYRYAVAGEEHISELVYFAAKILFRGWAGLA